MRVAGWVRSARVSKNVAFVALSDGSAPRTLQVVLERAGGRFEALIPQLLTGSSIEAVGKVVATPRAAQPLELAATQVTVVGAAPADDYPLQKKEHTMEFLRSIPHLRFRTATHGAVMRVRSLLSGEVRRFFAARDFVEVHTPIISTHDAEGAGALFGVGAHHTHPNVNSAKDSTGGIDARPPAQRREHFFGEPAFLSVSGQLNAECAASALGNVYTFGPTFRAENSHTTRHLSEFWMVEPEMAWCNLEGALQVAEDTMVALAEGVLARGDDDLALLEQRSPGLRERVQLLTHRPYAVIEYGQAVARLESAGVSFEHPVRWGADLQSEHEQWLVERYNSGRPLFVINYPQQIKAFYMRLNDDRSTVAAMDLLLPGVGEIIGGSQREERYDYLVAALTKRGISPHRYQWYLDLRRYGSVPHAGFGVGFDRLVLYISGARNVRDVVPFPRTPGLALC